jgi:hypothetical protein
MMKVTRTIGVQGNRIEASLTHTVATPEANSFDVATMLSATRHYQGDQLPHGPRDCRLSAS